MIEHVAVVVVNYYYDLVDVYYDDVVVIVMAAVVPRVFRRVRHCISSPVDIRALPRQSWSWCLRYFVYYYYYYYYYHDSSHPVVAGVV